MRGKVIASAGPARSEAQRQSRGQIWVSKWTGGCDVSLGLEAVDGRLRQSLEIRKFIVSRCPSLASHIGSLFEAWLDKGLLLFVIFYPDWGKGPTQSHITGHGWKGQKKAH